MRSPPKAPRSERLAAAGWCALAAMLLASLTLADAAPPTAAHVDGVPISLEAVDALSPALVRDVHQRLDELARETLRRLVEEHRTLAREPVEIHLPSAAELETPLAPERVVARVAGRPIAAARFERAAALRLYRLRGELHLERARRLEVLIERTLLRAEARRRGMSLEALEASFASAAHVSDAELQAYLAQVKAQSGRTLEAERARPWLAFRKAHEQRARLVEALRSRADVRIHLRAPARPRLPVDTRGGVTLVSADGPVLVVYTNYRCRLCRATHRELDRLRHDAAPPRIVLRDMVPPHDAQAVEMAALARCAARRGRVEEMRRALLATDALPPLEALARHAGTSPAELRACSRSAAIRERIRLDTQSALELGFTEPPGFIAAGVPLSGMQTANALRAALSGPDA